MTGLMMDYPLTLTHILEREKIARHFGNCVATLCGPAALKFVAKPGGVAC